MISLDELRTRVSMLTRDYPSIVRPRWGEAEFVHACQESLALEVADDPQACLLDLGVGVRSGEYVLDVPLSNVPLGDSGLAGEVDQIVTVNGLHDASGALVRYLFPRNRLEIEESRVASLADLADEDKLYFATEEAVPRRMWFNAPLSEGHQVSVTLSVIPMIQGIPFTTILPIRARNLPRLADRVAARLLLSTPQGMSSAGMLLGHQRDEAQQAEINQTRPLERRRLDRTYDRGR